MFNFPKLTKNQSFLEKQEPIVENSLHGNSQKSCIEHCVFIHQQAQKYCENTFLDQLQSVPLPKVWEDEREDFVLGSPNNLDVFERVGLTLTKVEYNNSTSAVSFIAKEKRLKLPKRFNEMKGVH